MHQVQSLSMRRSGFLIVLLCVAAVSFAAGKTDPFTGRWVGTISRPDEPLKVQVDLWQTDEGRWRGTMAIPSQASEAFPLEVDVKRTQIMFRILGIPGEPWFLGKLKADSIEGEFQAAKPYGLTLMRAVEETAPSK